MTCLQTRFVADRGRIPVTGTTLPGKAGWRGLSLSLDAAAFLIQNE